MNENRKSFRFALKVVASIGIGLFAAALWWQYSEKLVNILLPLIGM